MNKHSPTPWTIRPHLPDAHFEVVADANDNTVGTATLPENASLIVEAVNGRDRLRDIVRRMIDFMERKHAVSDHDRALLDEAREAVGESMKEGGEK